MRAEPLGAPMSFTRWDGLLEQVQDFPQAARYYYALAANTQAADANEKGLAGLWRILLTAP